MSGWEAAVYSSGYLGMERAISLLGSLYPFLPISLDLCIGILV